MVEGLPLTIGTGVVAVAMLYLALNLERDNKIRSTLATFFFGVGHVFLIATMFYAGETARATPTLGYLGDAFNTLMYVNIVVFMVFIFLFIITYVKTAVLTASGEEFEVEL